jgi:hypothetical protein
LGFLCAGQSVRGDPWLWLGSIGMGTYLGREDVVTDHHVASAVILSVQSVRAPITLLFSELPLVSLLGIRTPEKREGGDREGVG